MVITILSPVWNKNSDISLLLKRPPDLALLFNQFNNAIPGKSHSDPGNLIESKYYEVDEWQKLNCHLMKFQLKQN